MIPLGRWTLLTGHAISITEQAEMAFQANCLYEAKDTMTPVKDEAV